MSIRKSEKQFRKKLYSVKESDVLLAPHSISAQKNVEPKRDLQPFTGFHENVVLDTRNKLAKRIADMEKEIQEEESALKKKRGRAG